MLIAILLIYICYYFRFQVPILIVAWANLCVQLWKLYLIFFSVVSDKE